MVIDEVGWRLGIFEEHTTRKGGESMLGAMTHDLDSPARGLLDGASLISYGCESLADKRKSK